MPCVQLALNASDIDGCGRPPHQAVWQQASQAPFRLRQLRDRRATADARLLENRGDGAVCVGAFMGQLDASIVTLALLTLQRTFHASLGAVTWAGLSYLLAWWTRRIVEALTRWPGLRSSPWMRWYAQLWFSVASRPMSAVISALTAGRPSGADKSTWARSADDATGARCGVSRSAVTVWPGPGLMV